MATNHRGQFVHGGYFNHVNGWDVDVSPDTDGSHYMTVDRPYWACETGDCKERVGSGSYKTQGRAVAAGEALVKRGQEGRDLQTGRSGYTSTRNPDQFRQKPEEW